jgi:broad specificity phosphatase PhoE
MADLKKNYCTFYIVRHGETDWNVKQIMQGQRDSSLTTKGLKQAKQAAKQLKKIKFHAIFSSDLLRAKRTAEIIALEHQLIVKTKKALRERFLGKFEGKKVIEYQKTIKQTLKKLGQVNFDSLGIESPDAMIARFFGFIRQIAIAHPRKNILIITHAAVIRHALIHLGVVTYDQLPKDSIENAACLTLQSDGSEFIIKQIQGVRIREN